MGFSRQECWSGLPFSSPGNLPDPGIEPGSPTLQADALLSEPPGKQRGDGQKDKVRAVAHGRNGHTLQWGYLVLTSALEELSSTICFWPLVVYQLIGPLKRHRWMSREFIRRTAFLWISLFPSFSLNTSVLRAPCEICFVDSFYCQNQGSPWTILHFPSRPFTGCLGATHPAS